MVASPVPGHRVTFAYGVRRAHYAAGYHTGDDYAAPTGTPVVAVVDGEVRGPYNDPRGYGLYVILRGNNRRDYYYCHLNVVRATGRVKAGQRIGDVGNSGNSTGSHLHLEDRPIGGGYGAVRKPSWPVSKGTSAATQAASKAPKDWFDMASKEELKAAIREVLWEPVVDPKANKNAKGNVISSSWRNNVWRMQNMLTNIHNEVKKMNRDKK